MQLQVSTRGSEEVRKEGERDEPKIKGHQGRDIYPLLSVKYMHRIKLNRIFSFGQD